MLKKSVLFISSILFTPLVYALDSPFGSPGNLGDFIGVIGQTLHSLVTNKYSSFFILAIILFILLYNIFKAPLQKMPAFEGTPGKSIAVALTLLAELGIFYKSRETGIDGILSGIFGANNLFVGIVIAVLLFLLWKKVLGSISNNKFALLLTGISCFALDSLLQTPMMSAIGFGLILVSIIWFLAGHAKPISAKTFSSRIKDELGKTETTEYKERKREKKVKKEQKKEKRMDKEQHKITKKEFNLYEKLLDLTKRQTSSQSPFVYYPEIISIIKKIDESLEEEKDSYRKEFEEIRNEQKNLLKAFQLTKKTIYELKKEEDASKVDKKLNRFVRKEGREETRIKKLDKWIFKLDSLQKSLITQLVSYDEEIHKRLRSVESHQQQQKFKYSYKEVKGIKIILVNKEISLNKKNNLIKEQLHLSKKIKKIEHKVSKLSKKVGKEEKEMEEGVSEAE